MISTLIKLQKTTSKDLSEILQMMLLNLIKHIIQIQRYLNTLIVVDIYFDNGKKILRKKFLMVNYEVLKNQQKQAL